MLQDRVIVALIQELRQFHLDKKQTKCIIHSFIEKQRLVGANGNILVLFGNPLQEELADAPIPSVDTTNAK